MLYDAMGSVIGKTVRVAAEPAYTTSLLNRYIFAIGIVRLLASAILMSKSMIRSVDSRYLLVTILALLQNIASTAFPPPARYARRICPVGALAVPSARHAPAALAFASKGKQVYKTTLAKKNRRKTR